jgi:hypothetical protein
MGYFAAQVGADDDPVALHFPEVLGQHFFRRPRVESVQFAGPRWPFLKPTKNANLPFSLNQRQRKSDRSLFLSRKLAAFRNWMVCGLRRKETVQFTAHCGCRDMPGAVFRPIEIGNRHPCHIAPPLLDIGGLARCLAAGANPSEACSVITKGMYRSGLGPGNWNCFHCGGKLLAYTSG